MPWQSTASARMVLALAGGAGKSPEASPEPLIWTSSRSPGMSAGPSWLVRGLWLIVAEDVGIPARPGAAGGVQRRRAGMLHGERHERHHRDRVDRSHIQPVVGLLAGVARLPVLLCRPRRPEVWPSGVAAARATPDVVRSELATPAEVE